MTLIGAYTPDICFLTAQFILSGRPKTDISPSVHAIAGDDVNDEFFSKRYPLLLL
jgi:hypothetical protein